MGSSSPTLAGIYAAPTALVFPHLPQDTVSLLAGLGFPLPNPHLEGTRVWLSDSPPSSPPLLSSFPTYCSQSGSLCAGF